VFAAAPPVRQVPATGAAARSILGTSHQSSSPRDAGAEGSNRESAGSSAWTAREAAASGAGATMPLASQDQGAPAPFSAALRSHGLGASQGDLQSSPPPVAGAPVPAAPPVASPLRSLHELAAADPSLNAAAIGKNAHLRLETGRAGDLTMHLRINDGVADIEVGGAAAEKLGMRSNELRHALAGEGLTLGQFVTRPADGTGSDPSAQALPSATTPPPAAPGSHAASPSPSPSSSSSSSSFNQDHRQDQPRHGGESPDPAGAASGVSAANAARARAGGSSPANESPGLPRRGLHVTA